MNCAKCSAPIARRRNRSGLCAACWTGLHPALKAPLPDGEDLELLAERVWHKLHGTPLHAADESRGVLGSAS